MSSVLCPAGHVLGALSWPLPRPAGGGPITVLAWSLQVAAHVLPPEGSLLMCPACPAVTGLPESPCCRRDVRRRRQVGGASALVCGSSHRPRDGRASHPAGVGGAHDQSGHPHVTSWGTDCGLWLEWPNVACAYFCMVCEFFFFNVFTWLQKILTMIRNSDFSIL